MFSFYFLHTILGALVSAFFYAVSSIMSVEILGNSSEKVGNGLQVLTVLFSFPIFIIFSLVVTVIVKKIVGEERAPVIIYSAIISISILIGVITSSVI